MPGCRRRRRNERGASAVEFALTVIPLLLIVGGIINFGVVFSQKLALDNAVRQAARAAVVDTGTNGSGEAVSAFNATAIARNGVSPTIVVASDNVTTTCDDSDFGDKITVTGTFESKFLFPWMVPGLPKTVTLKSDGKFQCEYS
jgi:Flp pilus assembly protein TadG